jgi:CRISPR-associated endonuclease/helicase Cas3
LSHHQALTLKYVQDPDVEVIFNVAMTSDGKSLAAYLPVLKSNKPDESVLAMYPTKELIKDQQRQVEKYQE